jgi:predicted transcriptional regulator
MPALSDLNVEIWLFILHSGDWWTPLEIDGQFKFKEGTSNRLLQRMARDGVLEKKPVPGTRSVKFAATATCSVPVGKVQVRILAGERPAP